MSEDVAHNPCTSHQGLEASIQASRAEATVVVRGKIRLELRT